MIEFTYADLLFFSEMVKFQQMFFKILLVLTMLTVWVFILWKMHHSTNSVRRMASTACPRENDTYIKFDKITKGNVLATLRDTYLYKLEYKM